MVRTGVEADAIKAVAQAYTQATGQPVELMEIGRSGYYATLHTQLVAGADSFDLAQANDVDVGVLAEAKAIAPIGPYVDDPKQTDPKAYDPGRDQLLRIVAMLVRLCKPSGRGTGSGSGT